MERLKKIEKVLRCIKCSGNLKVKKTKIECKKCKNIYPIIDGIARFVDKQYYSLTKKSNSLQEKTKNYFGYEWDHFKDWGFISENKINKKQQLEWSGGSIEDRKRAFITKCMLSKKDLNNNKIILDAGCGNGRYTYEAAKNTKSIVIGVDIGYGAVQSAYNNTKKLKNVIIIQASLFDLPFKNKSIGIAFSNGVLMHTGNAKKAFFEISRTIKKKGIFVAHLYHKLNPIWEFNDWLIRKYTTKLSISKGMKFAKNMNKFAMIVNKIPGGLRFINLFIRLQTTSHHMFDWYSAPIATHHTYFEVSKWYKTKKFKIIKTNKPKNYWILKPSALTIKGIKNE